MDQETGFCRPYRSPGWSSWLPTSILSNPYHCGHLGSEPADSMWSLSQISNFNVTYWMSVKAGVVHMKRRGWKQELTPNQQDISGIRENLSSIYPQCSRFFFGIVRKCTSPPSSSGEQSDIGSRPVSWCSLFQGTQGAWAHGLLGDLLKGTGNRPMSCLHLCSHYNCNSGKACTHICLGVKVNTIDGNMKYYICAMGLIYSYCGIHNVVISWLWSAQFFRLNILLTFPLN